MSRSDEERREIESAVQRCYSTWGRTYYDEYYGRDAPYPPIHTDLIRRLVLESGARTVLDAGCGPASFMRHLAGDEIELFGFDLTQEMVEEGKRVLSDLGLEPRRLWQGSVLDGKSYRNPLEQGFPDRYDAVVCIGVMPHIGSQYDVTVFENVANALQSGGTAIVEARNELFSLFTMNRPSYEFIRNELIRADDLVAHCRENRPEIDRALEQFKSHFRMDLPPMRKGKAGEPGYDEIVSRLHNPLVARAQFAAAGFRDVRVLFYHYHAVPPMLAADFRDAFLRASIAMENPEDWRGYFMASAFLLVGIRA